MGDQLPRSLKWGRVRVSRIRKSTDNLRDAIRRGDMDAIQTAWDDYEQFVQYPFTPDPRVDGLGKALEDMADSLECEIVDRYPENLRNKYPSYKRKYDNEMCEVIAARRMVAEYKGGEMTITPDKRAYTNIELIT